MTRGFAGDFAALPGAQKRGTWGTQLVRRKTMGMALRLGAGEAEDVGGGGGAEGDEVGAVVPLVVDSGEEVLDVEGLVVCDAEEFEVEVDPAGLFVAGIEVDDDQDYVGRLCSGRGIRASCGWRDGS